MDESRPIALEARNLVKDYPGLRAVDGISFKVPEGICFGLLGPNGAGKTTTVEIIEGVIGATSGEVYYYGEIAGSRFRQEAGIQFQNTALQDYLTVRETIQLFRSLYDRQANIDDIIEQCSLGDLLDRDNRKLSGGQRQRLLLAVALVNRPRLIFLDEPTTGLDPQARRNFWELVKSIRADGAPLGDRRNLQCHRLQQRSRRSTSRPTAHRVRRPCLGAEALRSRCRSSRPDPRPR